MIVDLKLVMLIMKQSFKYKQGSQWQTLKGNKFKLIKI